jgi:phage gpG-like protein
MIEVKYNIDFKKVLKELEQEKLEDTLNEGVADKFAKNSFKFIKAGKVEPELSDNNPRKIKNKSAKPLFDTGKLAKSLKGNSKGISGVTYAKDHLKEGGYKFKGLPVPQRKFITADLPSEKSANNKIYKEFQKKFVTLLNKRIRKK